jgi:imidazolonepropionase-like amidohydrolase
VVVRGSKVDYVGPPRELPAGYEKLEYPEGVVCPGMVDLHTHIHSGGFGDVNDMVMPVNPEFRASSALRPSNELIKRACASGVTTLYGIPGSGTSMSGFGVVYKAKTHARFDDCVVRNPGGLKVAQAYNPERRAGDLGATRAGLAYILEDINHKAQGAMRSGSKDPALANLVKVHQKKLPVLIHCAGSDSFPAAARMWKSEFDTDCVLSHGCFDAHLTAPYEVALGVPINAGPRTLDYFSTRDGAITGIAAAYQKAGSKNLSLNTDSSVVPEEELFLQGSMSARLGADSYQMLRALTIHPAKVFGLSGRLGSLEPGKDADVVVRNGEPLDPRAHVETVLIDGNIEYDWKRDGQWF